MQQSPKKMVRRVFVICNPSMNNRQETVYRSSTTTDTIAQLMATYVASPGSTKVGWKDSEEIAVICLGDTRADINSFLAKFGTAIDPQGLSIQKVIQAEMDRRQNMLAQLKDKKEELAAFKADFCDENGILIDLFKVDYVELSLALEGHHRLSYCYDRGHALAVRENKEWSDLIPVVPSVFADLSELNWFQTKSNSIGEQKIKMTLLDLIKSLIASWNYFGSETQYRREIGELSTKRIKGGQDGEEDAAEGKSDAGTKARFIYAVARLAILFPRLEVLKCLTLPKSDPNHVPLKALSVDTKDPEACIPLVIRYTDHKELQDYCDKQGSKAPQCAHDLLTAINRRERTAWTKEDIETWWEGRKPNKNGGVIRSAISTTQERKLSFENMREHSVDFLKKAYKMVSNGPGSEDFQFFQRNEGKLNAFYDVIEGTPLGDQIDDIVKTSKNAFDLGIDAKPVLAKCFESLKEMILEKTKTPEVAVKAKSKSKVS